MIPTTRRGALLNEKHDQKNGELHLVIGGEAGQGIATIGELLCEALVRAGWEIVVSQSYHSRIRGGHNTFSIRMSGSPILAPVVPIDLLAALNTETVLLHEEEVKEGGLIIADAKWHMDGSSMLNVPYEDLGEKKVFNTVVLGIIGALLGLEQDFLRRERLKVVM